MARFGRYTVELSNTDKVFFPDAGISKGDLIDYYSAVAEWLVPHAKDRPLTLHRFPDGIDQDGFYQQQRSDYFPDWIQSRKTARVEDSHEDEKAVDHVLCNNQATLVYLANQGVITLHGWLSRAPRLTRPDRLIFDLDPAHKDFGTVRRAARQVAALMQQLNLTPYAMTTGSRGLHVVAPLRRGQQFDAVRDLAQAMAQHLAQQHSDDLTVEQRKDKRQGRIYLDVMRNAYGQTAVLPYAVRAKPGAPVATPLDLDELDDSGLDPQGWHIKNILRRLGQKGDPWADIRRHAVSIEGVRKALDKMRD
ncbi:ATP-dependent DNA ligase [Candidatus Tenderia electrophaga]|uniref:ATP-dependent DNA ligase n=1 Tax=Candidatus Tenderia electrophaga TaxID=1748243 RepID=A0A0S2TFP3_9GAMM|nr:ATP-dependent DNA ligase [Candidatus Tenderia electrophaga]